MEIDLQYNSKGNLISAMETGGVDSKILSLFRKEDNSTKILSILNGESPIEQKNKNVCDYVNKVILNGKEYHTEEDIIRLINLSGKEQTVEIGIKEGQYTPQQYNTDKTRKLNTNLPYLGMCLKRRQTA